MRLFLPLACLAAVPGAATDNDLRSVAAMQNHARVVLVFAPSLTDARLTRQRGEMARFATGAAERDLLLVQVAGGKVLGARDDARRLQRTFHVAAGAFASLLIGKDGAVALRASDPLSGARLEAAIDAMPMRQDEVRRAKAGLGKPAS